VIDTMMESVRTRDGFDWSAHVPELPIAESRGGCSTGSCGGCSVR
jgi:hypothetical protein